MTTWDIHLVFITPLGESSFGAFCVTARVTLPVSTCWGNILIKSPAALRSSLPRKAIEAPPQTESIAPVVVSTKLRLVNETERQDLDNEFIKLLDRANAGLEKYDPELVGEGEGGTYFLRSPEGEIIAVFKPDDEDPQSPSNPKKMNKQKDEEELNEDEDDRDFYDDRDEDSDESQDKLRASIPVGTTAFREVAAYRLDRGFSGVPTTALVEIDDWNKSGTKKSGSLQKFIPNTIASWDLGPAKYSTSDVQKIGILDIRMLNTDRHGGNMLAVALPEKGSEGNTHGLVPIDHGYCFPTSFAEGTFEWWYWPQAKKPFSEEMKEYIQKIDVEEDQRLLRSIGINEEEALRVNKVATLALKAGAEAGLNLYQLANICCRKDPEKPSPMELACEQVAVEMKQGGDYWCLMNEKINELVHQH